jgi:hypothetical protein
MYCCFLLLINRILRFQALTGASMKTIAFWEKHRVVLLKHSDVSEMRIAFIIRAITLMIEAVYLPKRWYNSTRLHGANE